MKKLYTIYDNVARDVGPIFLMAGDAAAVRFYGDIARDPQGNISKHPEDYDLLCLGTLDVLINDSGVKPEWRVVLTGAAWAAAQEKGS